MNVALGKHRFIPPIPVLVVMILFAALNLMIVLVNHYFLRTYTWDYGTYNFAFYDFAHLGNHPDPIFLVFVPYDISFMQDHLSLTLMLLSPFYWLFKGVLHSYTLLFLQWLFIIWGSWATYKLVEFKTKNWKLALLSVVYYYVLYGRYSSYQNDVNLAIIGACMLPVFFYYFETKNLWGSIFSFIFLCLNREDMPLCLFFIGIFFMIVHRRDKELFKLAGFFTIFSVLYFTFAFWYIIPSLESEFKKFNLFDYGALGSNPLQALIFILSHPLKAISYLFVNHTDDPGVDRVKLSFYIVYGLSGGILLLLRPLYIICLIPIIAKKMFNDSPHRWGYEMYYSIEVVSLLPIFVFSIFSEFRRNRSKFLTAIAVCCASASITYYSLNNAVNSGLGNIKINFLNRNFYNSDLDVKEIHNLMSLIPEKARVCATGDLVPQLAQRARIYHFPYIGDAEYVCLNQRANHYPVALERFKKEQDELLRHPDWKLVAASGPVLLLKKTISTN